MEQDRITAAKSRAAKPRQAIDPLGDFFKGIGL